MAGVSEFKKNNDAIVAKTIGRRLNLLRNSRDMTLAELAKIVSVSHQEISAYERGVRKPSLSILIGLSTYFNTSVDYLLGLEPIESALTHVDDDPRQKMVNFVKAG